MSEHQTDHHCVHKGFAGFQQVVIVLAEPCKSMLDDLAFGRQFMRHHPSISAALQDVENVVESLPPIVLAGSPRSVAAFSAGIALRSAIRYHSNWFGYRLELAQIQSGSIH